MSFDASSKEKIRRAAVGIWNKLKDQPEKGIIIFEGLDTVTGAPKYNKSKKEFADAALDLANKWIELLENKDKYWPSFVAELRRTYGIGVGTEAPLVLKTSKVKDSIEWWRKKKTHLSENGNYYVVPLVFERIFENPLLQPFISEVTGKLIISDGILKKTDDPIDKHTVFQNNAKKMALRKLSFDMSKALTLQNKDGDPTVVDPPVADAITYGFFPTDSKVASGGSVKLSAEAWHMQARPLDYQTLWLKVLFEKDWIDTLPSKTDPSLDFTKITREVMLFSKSFKEEISVLQKILYHLDLQLKSSNINIAFDPLCSAEKLNKLPEIINDFLDKNGKNALGHPKSTSDAIQFGFTEDLKLQYIAYSNLPDCLCDQQNINAYTLKKDINSLRYTVPFDSATMNGFLYYLPEINNKYSKYFKSSDVNDALFGTEESWLNFIRTYVYPSQNVTYTRGDSAEKKAGSQWQTLGKFANNPVWAKIAGGDYIKDPTKVLSPQTRDAILATANVANFHAGDDAVKEGLHAELKSIAALYDQVLDKVPVAELVKIAATMIFKCMASDEAKLAMCKTMLNAMPLSDVRTLIYPCLREQGEDGQEAIALLEEKVTGRKGELYAIAKARYPNKFTSSVLDDAKMEEMTMLYCADPRFQSKLGRSPDDFNDELAKWAEDKAMKVICDCVLSSQGPMQELLNHIQSAKEAVEDAAKTGAAATKAAKDAASVAENAKKLKSLGSEGLLALDDIFQPFYNMGKLGNAIGDFGEAIAGAIKDMATQLILAAVLVVLKYVRGEIFGNLMKDMCNSTGSGFGFKSLREMVEESELYEDENDAQWWDQIKQIGNKNGWAGELTTLADTISDLSNSFSPSELKHICKTPCGDSSADASYEKIQIQLLDSDELAELQQYPGISFDDLMADKEKSKKAGEKSIFGTEGFIVPINYLSIGQIQSIMLAVGALMNDNALEENAENFETAKQAAIALCTPGSAGESILCAAITEEDCKKEINKDKENMSKDLALFLPLIDSKQLEDMLPPMFCGPCNPKQVGKKPLMAQQTHPTQLYMHEKINREAYKIIDEVFNNNISIYKDIIMETPGAQLVFQGDLISKIPDEIKSATAFGEASAKAVFQLAQSINDMEETSNPDEFVASSLRSAIENSANLGEGFNKIISFDPIEKYAEFMYSIPNSTYKFYLIFNFSENAVTLSVTPNPFKPIITESYQIKIVVVDTATGDVDFEWPPVDSKDSLGSESVALKDFNIDDLKAGIVKYGQENLSAPTAFYNILGENPALFEGVFPIASNYIFETVFLQGTSYDLFKRKYFTNLPLTNAEVKEHCEGNAGTTPLLNPEGVLKNVDEARKALECVTSMFASPDAVQISNVYGLYNLMIKVCVVEEYLKNIFIFAFVKLADILKTDAYMEYMLRNLKDLVDTSLGIDGYENLLEYSEKIINGRQQLGELSEEETLEALKSKTSCLEILIRESAEEINDILDDRVQLLVDPEWKNTFDDWNTIADEGASDFWSRFLQYAIIKDYMDAPLFPAISPPAGEGKMKHGIPAFMNCNDWESDVLPKGKLFKDYQYKGGLFFEPYVRLESKLDEVDDPEGSLKIFWKQFKKSYDLYKDINKKEGQPYNQIGGCPPAATSYPTNNPMKWGSSSKWVDKAAPPGLVNVYPGFKQTPGPMNDIFETIDSMISTIDLDSELVSSETFEKFFKLFFVPLKDETTETDGHHYPYAPSSGWTYVINPNENTPAWAPGKVVMPGAKARITLERIVSSFDSHNSNLLAAPPYAGLQNSDPTTTSTWWLNSYYYWQSYPYGEYLEGSWLKKSYNNFRNRGIINIDTVSPSKKPSENYDPSSYGFTGLGNHGVSTIEAFASAKQQRIVWGAYSNPATDTDADQGGPGPGYFRNPFDIGLDSLMKYCDEIRDFMIDHGSALAAAEEETTISFGDGAPIGEAYPGHSKERKSVAIFWSVLRDIFLDSPFPYWFDFKVGMRLNLVTQLPEGPPGAAEALQGLVDDMSQKYVAATLASPEMAQKYVNDKSFLLQGGKPNTKYFCLPLDYVEYSAEDYWDTYTTVPDFNGKLGELDEQVSKNISPWHDVFWGGENDWMKLQLIPDELPTNGAYQTIPAWTPMDTAPFNLNNSPSISATQVNKARQRCRPTLWMTSRLLQYALTDKDSKLSEKAWPLQPSEFLVSEEGNRGVFLARLKSELSRKIMGEKGRYADYSLAGPNKLLNELFPIKESIISTVFVYRYFMQAAYPELRTLLEPTKQTINAFVAQAIAAINGDYEYTNESTKDMDPAAKLETSSPGSKSIGEQFMLLIVQMAANMVDPTWKTPWFMPGPITPVGVLAKVLAKKKGKKDVKDKEDLEDKSILDKESCEDKKEESSEEQ